MPEAPPSTTRQPGGTDYVILVLSALLRNIHILVFSATAFVAIALLVLLLRGRTYTAESTFAPETGSTRLGQYAGIAAQLGMSLPQGGLGESIDFYAALIESPVLLRDVGFTRYRFPADGAADGTVEGTIPEIYELDADTEALRTRSTVRLLQNLIRVEVDHPTGLVTVQTTASWPALAIQLNERIIALVQEFNIQKRQSRAAAEREFLETRLEEARKRLESSERAFQRFLEGNRRYEDSPELSFEATRLQRRIALDQQLYSTLAQSYEQAQIEEVRNTPVITVINAPGELVTPSRFALPLVLAGFLGLAVGAAFVFLKEYYTTGEARGNRAGATLRESARQGLAGFRFWRRTG